jgi:hypothetical protein
MRKEDGRRRRTAIAHDHDFGIDTELVPGPPVRIHARIGGHRSGSRGKEGTRKSSAGGESERGKRKRGRGDEERLALRDCDTARFRFRFRFRFRDRGLRSATPSAVFPPFVALLCLSDSLDIIPIADKKFLSFSKS